MSALGPGRIFWAADSGPRGEGKKRPMVVVNPRTDIVRTGTVLAVVCSTGYTPPPMEFEVELPWHPGRLVVTRLPEPTVAVCNWRVTLPAAGLKAEGIVPTHLLRVICERAGIEMPRER
jgi:mRNA-degrading endonuclease toxin of MazEF toxin-antitoxin module